MLFVDFCVVWKALPTVPSKDISDVLTGAMVLGDVAVRASMDSSGLKKLFNTDQSNVVLCKYHKSQTAFQ